MRWEVLKQIKESTSGIILFGASANDLKKTILNSSYQGIIIIKNTLDEATKASIEIAIETETKSILLSPACASFDQYKNYEERGNHFKNILETLNLQNN